MRSIWSIYKGVRDNDNDNTGIATNVTNIAAGVSSLAGLTIKANSQGGTLAGSSTMRIINVASCPVVIPLAGTMVWDSTKKCVWVSNGTSFHTTEGSLAIT